MSADESFRPGFGVRPPRFLGRDAVIKDFTDGLAHVAGHPQRAILLSGDMGAGKTSLLLEFSEIAVRNGFVPALVDAREGMAGEIVRAVRANAADLVDENGPGSDNATGPRFNGWIELRPLCDELARRGKGVLVLVDNVDPDLSEARSLPAICQRLMGDGRDVAIVMAGAPALISNLQSAEGLGFLNRWHKLELDPLPLADMASAYAAELGRHGLVIGPEPLSKAVAATRGYPYLFQLIGRHVLERAQGLAEISENVVDDAVLLAKQEMTDNVFNAVLGHLSPRDRDFLRAMSEDSERSVVADVAARLKVSGNYAQKYRARLIRAGVIAPAGRGMVTFIVPFLREHLRGEF